jgi:hypothetical protein
LKELEKFENIEKIILFNDYEQVDENEKILSYKKAPKESDIFLSYITNKYIFF